MREREEREGEKLVISHIYTTAVRAPLRRNAERMSAVINGNDDELGRLRLDFPRLPSFFSLYTPLPLPSPLLLSRAYISPTPASTVTRAPTLVKRRAASSLLFSALRFRQQGNKSRDSPYPLSFPYTYTRVAWIFSVVQKEEARCSLATSLRA